MGGHVGEGEVQVRLVAAGRGHGHLGVVGNQQLRHPPEELEGMDMRPYPVGQLLGGANLGVGEAGCPQGHHEELRFFNLARLLIHDGDGLPGEVAEGLLPGLVLLAHGHLDLSRPSAVEPAELGVGVVVPGMLGPVLLPEQLQGDPFARELFAYVAHVRKGFLLPPLGLPVEQALQRTVIYLLRQGPGYTRLICPLQALSHCGGGYGQGAGDLPVREPDLVSEPQDLFRLSHG